LISSSAHPRPARTGRSGVRGPVPRFHPVRSLNRFTSVSPICTAVKYLESLQTLGDGSAVCREGRDGRRSQAPGTGNRHLGLADARFVPRLEQRRVLSSGSGTGTRPNRPRGAGKNVCRACPVVAQCRAHALAVHEPYGVWGGLTADERKEQIRADTAHTDTAQTRADDARPLVIGVDFTAAGHHRRSHGPPDPWPAA
jgi:hypothetical protein